MVEMDKLLDQDLEHIGEALKQTQRTDTVRTETALERGADLTLEVNIEKCQQRVHQKETYAYEDTFHAQREPPGHKRQQCRVYPIGNS